MQNALKVITVFSPPGQPDVRIVVEVGVLTDEGEFASLGRPFNADGSGLNTFDWTDNDLKTRVLAHDPAYADYVIVGINNEAF